VSAVVCPYCTKPAQLVGGDVMYPHRSDLHEKKFYRCLPCGAHVGCHDGTVNPLGRLANAELRQWKQRAHAAFDPLWQGGKMKRRDAYQWLADGLGIPFAEAHIGMFDVATCQRVIGMSFTAPAAPAPAARPPASVRHAEMLVLRPPVIGSDYKPLCNCQPPWEHCEHTVIVGMVPTQPKRKSA
jgi:hypothetical protein